MPRFPYMSFPFPYYKNIPKNPYNLYSKTSTSNTDFKKVDSTSTFDIPMLCDSSNSETRKKNKSNNNYQDYLFDLFGLKLYTDDVLLVSLIYFLYSEGVKDEGLFIVLILLLLS